MKTEQKVNFEKISEYWDAKHPGRLVAQGLSENEEREDFFRTVDEYRYHSDHYEYLVNKSFFSFKTYKGKDVLEIGCGLGSDLERFALAGSNVFAIDATKSAENSLRQRFALKRLNYDFKTADFRKIPYERKFDLVYSFGVLHHSPWIKEGIKEAANKLKPDGELIIMLYHKGFKYYIKKLFFRGILQGKFLNYSKQEILNLHTEEFGESPTTLVFSRKEAKTLLDPYFDIIKMRGYRLDDNLTLPMLGKVFPIRTLTSNNAYNYLSDKFGWNLMIHARLKKNV
jgi:2-polyprenyl-3-methyl-5-hydroxy-6-metoxy-1,4-benzoquinol methylase